MTGHQPVPTQVAIRSGAFRGRHRHGQDLRGAGFNASLPLASGRHHRRVGRGFGGRMRRRCATKDRPSIGKAVVHECRLLAGHCLPSTSAVWPFNLEVSFPAVGLKAWPSPADPKRPDGLEQTAHTSSGCRFELEGAANGGFAVGQCQRSAHGATEREFSQRLSLQDWELSAGFIMRTHGLDPLLPHGMPRRTAGPV